jgi:hypothetical protein
LAPGVPVVTPLQSVAQRAGSPCPKAGRPPWSWRGLQRWSRLRHCGRSRSAVSSRPGWVADRWPSPHALLGSSSAGPTVGACEGLPILARLGVGSTSGPTLLAFASPLKTHSNSRGPLPSPAHLRPCGALPHSRVGSGLLSWGCQRSPLHRHQYPASTPGLAWPCRVVPRNSPGGACPGWCVSPEGPLHAGTRHPPSARSCQAPDSFRPCRSSRLRRFSPPGTLQVCCALLPIMGFATFPVVHHAFPRAPCGAFGRPVGFGFLAVTSAGLAASAPSRLPQGATVLVWCGTGARLAGPSPVAPYPSERFPRQQPCRVTATIALSPLDRLGLDFRVTSTREGLIRPSGRRSSTSGLCSAGESVAASHVAVTSPLDAPMGFGPMRGSVFRCGHPRCQPFGTGVRPGLLRKRGPIAPAETGSLRPARRHCRLAKPSRCGGLAGLTAFTLDPAMPSPRTRPGTASRGKSCPPAVPEGTALGPHRHHVQQSAAEGWSLVLSSSGLLERCNPGTTWFLLAGRAGHRSISRALTA